MAGRVPAAGSLLLGLLACGARAERAWGTALQAELAMPASGSLHWLGGGRDQSAGPGEAESPLGPVLQRQGPHRQSSAASGGPRPTGPEKAESFRASGDGGGPLRSGGPPDRLAVPGAKLVRESSQLGALGSVRPVARRAHSTEEEQAAASGTDAREQRRFLEHLHADGTPPDALARAEQQLDGSGVREKAVLLPEEPAVDCNTKDVTDPKQMLAMLHGCTKALDRFGEQTRGVERADRAANEKDVEALRHTAKDLLAIKEGKSFHEAWDEDQQAALRHLMEQVSRDEATIKKLAAEP